MKPYHLWFLALRFAKFSLAKLAITSLILQQFFFVYNASAQALPIAVDGVTNTQVGKTASGIDQINIATPNSSGLSHNKFNDYNINKSGQIINNFSGKNPDEIAGGSGANAVTQTQIGGLVVANPNLQNSNSAKVILNEVTSTNRSQLLGYAEIAGSKADLIIANPNGISCSGCGFINTARLLMIAGKSQFDENSNLSFDLAKQKNPNLYIPLITIDELGLDVGTTSTTEIISSSIKLLSTIYGSENTELYLKSADGKYDYNSGQITSDDLQNDKQFFAIDAANLAKIQAGQVYIIANQNGVGVKMAGEILAVKSINIDANGDIYYNKISAGDDTNLQSSGAIQTIDSNSAISAPIINIKANQFDNAGTASAYNLNIHDSEAFNNSGNIEALNLNLSNITNINNSGFIFGQNSLAISGGNLINNSSGQIYSPIDYTINLNGSLANSALIASGNNLTINSNQLSNSSEISAQNNLIFSVVNSANNSGDLIAKNILNFSANSLINSGLVQSNGSLVFNLFSLVNQQDAAIYSTDFFDINVANNLQNFGELISNDSITINSPNFTNLGNIISAANLNLSSLDLVNGGNIQSGQNMEFNSASLDNNGLINSSQNLTITADEISNQSAGTILTTADLKLNANALENLGMVFVGNNFITNSSSFTNFGSLYSAGNFNIANGLNLINSGTFYSDGNLQILSGNIINNSSALIYGNQDISLITNLDFVNAGAIQATDNINLLIEGDGNNSGSVIGNWLIFNSSGNLTNSGTIGSENNIILSATNFTNLGLLQTVGDAQINLSGSFDNQDGSVIYSSGNLNFILAASFKNSGEISANQELVINSFDDLSNSGNILANAALTISANNLSNNSSATIASLLDSVSLTSANNLINNGEIISKSNLEINTKNLSNIGDILSKNNLAINAQNSVSNSGNLQSLFDLNLNTENLSNSNVIKSFGASLINSALIDNKNDGVIYSDDNLTFISSSTFTNSGNILSASNVNLSANLTNNSGEVFANQNLALNLTDSFANSGSISALGNLSINSNSDINNNNQILSNGTLNIAAKDLTNSNLIQSNGDLFFTIRNLNNSDNITSDGAFDINALGNISNGGILQSTESFTIDADSFSNLGSSLILSGDDLTIRAANINNQNTKPSNLTISSGIVSANGAVSLLTDNLNNNAGLVTGKSTSVLALNNSQVNLNNNLGAFISTAAINLNLGNIDYTITGTITASNIDIAANNITNKGNVSAFDFIKLTATGTGALGRIINGIAGGDNSNIGLAAGTYVDLTANGNIQNYATISATTDLNLTSNQRNIQNFGKIIGGNGDTTINALNGSFTNQNQNAIFTANNQAIFNVRTLSNSGEISSAQDLIINASGNLNNNPTALIWSGKDITFNVSGNVINNQADIYAENNLTIQKNNSADANSNKANLLQNISGNIETFAGDLVIKAKTLENKRTSYATQNDPYFIYNYKVDGRYWHDLTQFSFSGENGILAQITSGGNASLQLGTLKNDGSLISSQGNFAIDAADIQNISHYVYEGTKEHYTGKHGYWGGPGDGWVWSGGGGWNYHSEKYVYTNQLYATAFIKSGASLTITQNGAANPSLINGDNIAQNAVIAGNSKQFQNTSINQIDVYQLAETGVINVDLSAITSAISNNKNSSADSSTPFATISSSSSIHKDSVLAPKTNISANLSSEIISASANSTNSNIIFSGNFKINLDSSATTPLVESRSQFTDISKFFGSSYYFNQLGLNGPEVLADLDLQTRNTNTRILGDAFVETKLILDQLKTLTNNSLFLSENITDANSQIKELLDNAVNQFAALGLNANDVAINGLTKEQSNSLSKDIITFELTNIDGISVLAPKLYLSQNTRNRLLNSDSANGSALANSATIFAKENLIIDAPQTTLFNSASIKSGGDIFLNLAAFTNKTNAINQAQISAQKNLAIIANSGDIKNIGANISAIGTLNLAALQGNITNASLIATNDKNLLTQNGNVILGESDFYVQNGLNLRENSGNISSTLLQNALIKAGEVNISAAGDFNNLAANISATKNNFIDNVHGQTTSSGDINIASGGDLNIANLQLRNREEIAWGSAKKGGSIITDKIENLQSEISGQGNLNLLTDNSLGNPSANINIIGSKISAGDNININSAQNLNITNAVNSDFLQTQTWKKGLTRRSNSSSVDYVESAVASELTGKNINLSSNDNVLIQGSNLDSANDLTIGKFTLIQNPDGTYQKDQNGNYLSEENHLVNNVVIQDANLNSYHNSSRSSGYRGVAKIAANITSIVIGSIDLGLNWVNSITSPITKEIDDPLQKLAKKTYLPDFISDKIDAGYMMDKKDQAKNTSLYNIAQRDSKGQMQQDVFSSNLHSGNNVEIAAHEDVAIIASNIETGNLNIGANNLSILSNMESISTNQENKLTRSMMFSIGTAGTLDSSIVNSNLTATGDFNFDVNGNITTSYDSKLFDADLGVLTGNEAEISGLNYLTNLKENKNNVNFNPLTETHKTWDDKVRGLTGTSQVMIAVAAAAVAIGTGGVGVGLSGAMMTAAAATAGTTATISATNASMNTDSNIWRSAKSISSTTLKNTTSKESIQNMAIASALAGAGYGVGQWMKSVGVDPSLKSGAMENSKVGVNVEKVDGQWFIEGKDIKANWFDTYVTGNQNPAFQSFNTTPGAPPFADFHDAMNFPVGVNQITIAPYYAMSQCAAMPTVCAMFPDTFVKVGTWGKVDTNLDIYKNNYEQKSN